MSKKRVCSLLLIFALVLASFNVNLVEANAAAKPNIKRVTLVSSVTTSVSWNKVSGASKYEVYCAKNNGNFKRVKTTKGTSCSFKKLDLGTKYSYKIRAIVKVKKARFQTLRVLRRKIGHTCWMQKNHIKLHIGIIQILLLLPVSGLIMDLHTTI